MKTHTSPIHEHTRKRVRPNGKWLPPLLDKYISLGGTANISSIVSSSLVRLQMNANELTINSYKYESKLLLHVTSFKVIDTYTYVFISHSRAKQTNRRFGILRTAQTRTVE